MASTRSSEKKRRIKQKLRSKIASMKKSRTKKKKSTKRKKSVKSKRRSRKKERDAERQMRRELANQRDEAYATSRRKILYNNWTQPNLVRRKASFLTNADRNRLAVTDKIRNKMFSHKGSVMPVHLRKAWRREYPEFYRNNKIKFVNLNHERELLQNWIIRRDNSRAVLQAKQAAFDVTSYKFNRHFTNLQGIINQIEYFIDDCMEYLKVYKDTNLEKYQKIVALLSSFQELPLDIKAEKIKEYQHFLATILGYYEECPGCETGADNRFAHLNDEGELHANCCSRNPMDDLY